MTEKMNIEYDEDRDKATEFRVADYKLRNRTFRTLMITVHYELPIPMDEDFEEALTKKPNKPSRARMMFAYDMANRKIVGDYDQERIKKAPLISYAVKDEEIHNAIMNNSEPHVSTSGKKVEGLWSAPIRVTYAATADDEGYATTCTQLIAIAVPDDDEY